MRVDIEAAMKAWPQVAPLLTPAKSKADYERLVAALDAVLDAGGADEKHPLAGLADALGELVADYERVRVPLREMSVPDFLRELMRQHGLKQSELPEIGKQSVVSAVLSGKRRLNLRQVAALRSRFHLPADALI
jgi:HTH-type transcriptional regulator / antitoxin HigA